MQYLRFPIKEFVLGHAEKTICAPRDVHLLTLEPMISIYVMEPIGGAGAPPIYFGPKIVVLLGFSA